MRVSPPWINPAVTPAAKPPAGAAGSVDAYRQTGFVLQAEIDLVIEGLELEGAVASASSGAKHRTQQLAAVLGPWSRSWLCRQQALHALQWGNYAAALPLARAAAEQLAAAVALLEDGAAEWLAWLAADGIAAAPADHAMAFRLPAAPSAGALATYPELDAIARAATDLALPHFASTLLVAGFESTPERVRMTFGDRDMHLGLAEIVLGWLAELGAIQVERCLAHEGAVAIRDGDRLRAFVERARQVAARPDRCRIEALDRPDGARYLVRGWRRRAGDAASRILL